MKVRKSDWTIVRGAEEKGLVAAMTSLIERKRTELNKELSDYFRKNVPDYTGIFDEDKCEDVLDKINTYMEENNINRHPLEFPLSSESDVRLVPIGENIELKILIADEYYGDGDYDKYVDISFFLINEKTTKQDVDVLIEFVRKYLL